MPFTQAYHDLVSVMTNGESFTPYNAANARLGAGNSSTSFSPGQTNLQGTSLRRGMESGYPDRLENNKIVYQALFAEDDANFVWNEYGLFNAASGGVMLIREVENLGTKAQGTIWRFTVTVEWIKS